MNLPTKEIKSVLSQDELDSKIESYLNKIKENPGNPWLYSDLGDYLLEINKIQKAYLFYKKAVDIKPDFHGFYYKLGVVSQKLQNFQESNFYYATSITLNPENYWYYDSLCQNLIDNNQITQAITYYQQALKLEKQIPKIYRQLGFLYLKQGKTQQAITYYQKVIEIEPNKFDYLYLADALLQENEVEQAISCYQKALNLSEEFQEAHQKIGDVLTKKGEFDQGIIHFRKAKYLREVSSNNNFLSWSDYNYLVDRQHHFVYCPIPKVACSSLKKLMLKIQEPENFASIINNLSGMQFHIYIDHAYSLFQYKKEEVNAILQGNQYFKFVFVRNPWNRLVSAYLNKFVPSVPLPVSHQVIESIYKEKGLSPDIQKSITFRQFIHYLVGTEDQALNNHWRPQYLFLGNNKFDFIGKFENIAQDFQFVKQKLNLDVDLDWLNKTEKTDHNSITKSYADFYPETLRQLETMPNYQSFYTPELIELVRNRYQTDIQMFDYKFE